MTATVRGRAAEVLLEHLFRTAGSQDGYLGTCSCVIERAHTEQTTRSLPLYQFDEHLAHQADALAAAGLLAGESHADAMREYATALEQNESAEVWNRREFVADVREWADEIEARP